MSKTFKSYVSFSKDTREQEKELEDIARASHDVKLEPDLLPGELVIAECQGVLKFKNYTERKQGVSGALFVTNFKISFVSVDKVTKQEDVSHQRNLLLDEDDISLNCVDAVYQVSKGRKKKLLPSTGFSGRVKKVDLYCKDFRIHRFSFKFVREKGQEKKVLQAILHHAFPSKVELLFAFEYAGLKENLCKGSEYETVMFDNRIDWEREVQRCNASQDWRVTVANTRFELSLNLPEYFVVPRSLTNNDLSTAGILFVENRISTWCYTHAQTGASLVRLGSLRPDIDSEFRQQEARILDFIKKAHPKPGGKKPHECDVTLECPLVKDIQMSFEKLKELCMPGSLKNCQSSDAGWYSSLEATHWLDYVASCLMVAGDVVQKMTEDKRTVVLRESSGCDLTCVVSSLVQLCLDPYFRTFHGFQSLVQKEFVAMGFHFLDRCGHLASREEESPVFLLFLDCVWQLQRQFPSTFAFTETYLTSLWDSVHIGLFATFIFNSPGQRSSMTSETFKPSQLSLIEVWDLKQQYTEEHLTLFKNPLCTAYEAVEQTDSRVANGSAGSLTDEQAQRVYSRVLCGLFDAKLGGDSNGVIVPLKGAANIELWSLCYLRWLLPVQIVNGGAPSGYFQQCLLVEEIVQLHQKLCRLKTRPHMEMKKTSSDLIFGLDTPQVTQLLDSVVLTSSFPFSTAHSNAPFLATPLRAFVHQSSVLNGKDSMQRQSSFKTYLEDSTEAPNDEEDEKINQLLV